MGGQRFQSNPPSQNLTNHLSFPTSQNQVWKTRKGQRFQSNPPSQNLTNHLSFPRLQKQQRVINPRVVKHIILVINPKLLKLQKLQKEKREDLDQRPNRLQSPNHLVPIV